MASRRSGAARRCRTQRAAVDDIEMDFIWFSPSHLQILLCLCKANDSLQKGTLGIWVVFFFCVFAVHRTGVTPASSCVCSCAQSRDCRQTGRCGSVSKGRPLGLSRLLWWESDDVTAGSHHVLAATLPSLQLPPHDSPSCSGQL